MPCFFLDFCGFTCQICAEIVTVLKPPCFCPGLSEVHLRHVLMYVLMHVLMHCRAVKVQR